MDPPTLASPPVASGSKGKWKAFLESWAEGSSPESTGPQAPAAAKCKETDELSDSSEAACFADTLVSAQQNRCRTSGLQVYWKKRKQKTKTASSSWPRPFGWKCLTGNMNHYWCEENFMTVFPEWDGLRDPDTFSLSFYSCVLADFLFRFGVWNENFFFVRVRNSYSCSPGVRPAKG